MLPEEVPGAACRLLGFGRTSAEMDAVVDALVQEALQSGALVARGDFLVCEA